MFEFFRELQRRNALLSAVGWLISRASLPRRVQWMGLAAFVVSYSGLMLCAYWQAASGMPLIQRNVG